MKIGLGQHLQLKQGLELHAKVKLIQEARLLALTALELQVDIRSVLEENPFLELAEDEREQEAADEENEERDGDDGELEDWVDEAIERGNYQEEYPQQYASEESFDPLSIATRPRDIRDHLLREYVLQYDLPQELTEESEELSERWILELIIGNLDDRGFLPEEEFNELVEIESPGNPDPVQAVRRKLQMVFPAGCGSRDLQIGRAHV